MIDIELIERLIRILDDSSVDSLEIERGGTRVKLAKTPPGVGPVGYVAQSAGPASTAAPAPQPTDVPGAAPAARPSVPASHLLEITAPMVGTFYGSPAPDAAAYVDVGTRVRPGDTLCIIEAMKLMNELECEISGTLAEVCVENGQPVEFGQVLFRVDPG